MIVSMRLLHLLHVIANMRQTDVADFGLMTAEPDLEAFAARQYLKAGLNFTVLDSGGVPVACFGFIEDAPRVATAWLMATDHWRAYVKSVKRAFNVVVKDGAFARIQAFVRPENPAARKFIEWLGFKLDGALPKIAAGGATMLLYSFT